MRRLSQIEEAFTLANMAYPLSVVCVLKVQHGPSAGSVQFALDQLQQIHPLLRAEIKKDKNQFWFQSMKTASPIPLQQVERTGDQHWLAIARREISTSFNHSKGPLMKVIYIQSPDADSGSEIVLSFHHAIIDGESLLYMANQLLAIAGGDDTSRNRSLQNANESSLSPVLESVLPHSFKGPGFIFRIIPFMARQLTDMIRYNHAAKKIKDYPVPASSANDLLTIHFSKETTTELVKWVRKKRLTLNILISAAMLLAVSRHRYGGQKKLLRVIQFANLRPYLKPPVAADRTGCFVSMMRFSVPVTPETSLEELATFLNGKINISSERGEKFLYARLSKILVRQTLRKHSERLGATALSYAGPLALKEQYGSIRLTGIHGFISNNCLGPELTGFGKICFGRLSLDMNFMPAEMTRDKAVLLADEVKHIMEQLIAS